MPFRYFRAWVYRFIFFFFRKNLFGKLFSVYLAGLAGRQAFLHKGTTIYICEYLRFYFFSCAVLCCAVLFAFY